MLTFSMMEQKEKQSMQVSNGSRSIAGSDKQDHLVLDFSKLKKTCCKCGKDLSNDFEFIFTTGTRCVDCADLDMLRQRKLRIGNTTLTEF